MLHGTRAPEKPGQGVIITFKCMQGKSTLTISNLPSWQQILSFHIPVCNDRGDEYADGIREGNFSFSSNNHRTHKEGCGTRW
jgi:hypothetical protein